MEKIVFIPQTTIFNVKAENSSAFVNEGQEYWLLKVIDFMDRECIMIVSKTNFRVVIYPNSSVLNNIFSYIDNGMTVEESKSLMKQFNLLTVPASPFVNLKYELKFKNDE